MAIAAGASLLLGCPYVGDDDDSGSNTWAPVIEDSFPSDPQQSLQPGGSITFSAAGQDPDSLQLNWAFLLDEQLVAGGTDDSGSFDVSWSFAHDEAAAGDTVAVAFEVDDGDYVEAITWSVAIL